MGCCAGGALWSHGATSVRSGFRSQWAKTQAVANDSAPKSQ